MEEQRVRGQMEKFLGLCRSKALTLMKQDAIGASEQ